MNTTPLDNRSAWRRFVDFWFAPADPTPLGFIRIVTGLLALYVHAAYCFDLRAFFGPDGWYSLTAINRERTEYPWFLGPVGDYDDSVAYRAPRLPDFPHRKAAVLDFVNHLPAARGDRGLTLRYLTRLQDTKYQPDVRDGLAYVNQIGLAAEHRKARLDALEDEAVRTARDAIPDFLKAMPKDGANGRTAVRKEIERFLDSLPKDYQQREYVLNHLTEMDFWNRQAFLDFLVELPDDPAERAKAIDFLEFWNSEPKRAHHLGHPLFSIWFHITDPAGMAAAHGVILVVMFLFTIGLWTRVTSVVTWLAAVSYIHRTQHVLFGMDTMMNILLLYLMVGPSGAALSADRLIQRFRASRASLGRSGRIDAPTAAFLQRPPMTASAGLALRLIQVHFCFIYMASGLSKLKGPAWWNTNAFWDTLVNPEFCLVQYVWFEDLLRNLVGHRVVYGFMAAGGVIFTLALEIGLPFLVWTRLRPYVVIGAFLLHLGIAAFMGLYLFGLFMMTLLMAYLPGSVIREQLFGPPPAGAGRVTLRFDNKAPRSRRAAALAKALDFDDRVTLAEGPATAVVAGGAELTGPPAARELAKVLAFSGLVKCLLAVPVVGPRLAGCLAPV